MTRCPTGVEPVNDTIETSGWLTSASPTTRPAPMTTLTTPAGRPAADAVLREHERRQRGHLRGLEDDRVAGRDGRQDLPHRHLQRVVPRGDRADDADAARVGSATCGRRPTRPRPCPPGAGPRPRSTRRCRWSRARRTRSSAGWACPSAGSRPLRTPPPASRAARPAASSARERSAGGAVDQSWKASVAAATARSTSPASGDGDALDHRAVRRIDHVEGLARRAG